MQFGEKLREARKKAGLKQKDLARAIGVSLRTITNYETANVYPKKREHYYKLAEVLGVDVNYLMADGEAFITDAAEKYGLRGAKQARALVRDVTGLFAGGELDQDDMDVMMKAIMDAYWAAKEKNRKYAPEKHLAEK